MGVFLQKLSQNLAGWPAKSPRDFDMKSGPSRKILPNTERVTGQIATTKHRGAAVYESGLERDLIEILEFNGTVRCFLTQPPPIHYEYLGRKHRYTPDVEIEWLDSAGSSEKWLCEVKYRADLFGNWTALKPKFKAAIRHCRQNGMRFKILTENEIRTVYLENVRFLRQYKNTNVTDYRVNPIYANLVELRETTPEILLKSLGCGGGISAAEMTWLLWAMIANGIVSTDMLSPLSMDSPIWARESR